MIADDILPIQYRIGITLGDQRNALSAIQFVTVVSYSCTLLHYYFANFSFTD